MTMGERIKQLRSVKGFTQEMLAEKMNVSRSAIAKWEADGGIPDVDNLIQLSFVFNISVDELVGNSATTEHSKRAETTNYEVHDFGSQLHDIELSGWNDGVSGVYIIAEDQNFLYYYQSSDKSCGVYGVIGKKHITSVSPVKGKKPTTLCIKKVSREYFCDKPVKIELAKRDGLIKGFFDFRDDDYRNVVICSFGSDTLHLQFGGTLNLVDITKIEELIDL